MKDKNSKTTSLFNCFSIEVNSWSLHTTRSFLQNSHTVSESPLTMKAKHTANFNSSRCQPAKPCTKTKPPQTNPGLNRYFHFPLGAEQILLGRFLIQKMHPTMHSKSIKAKDSSLVSYYIMCFVRIAMVFIPQVGYIHPDEFFQTVEVVAGECGT